MEVIKRAFKNTFQMEETHAKYKYQSTNIKLKYTGSIEQFLDENIFLNTLK